MVVVVFVAGMVLLLVMCLKRAPAGALLYCGVILLEIITNMVSQNYCCCCCCYCSPLLMRHVSFRAAHVVTPLADFMTAQNHVNSIYEPCVYTCIYIHTYIYIYIYLYLVSFSIVSSSSL